MRVFLMGAVALAAMTSPALTSPASAETFAVQAVDIVHAAARVTVIPENRTDISVETQAGPRLAAPTIRRNGERLVIDGGLRNRIRGCGGFGVTGNNPAVQVNGVGRVALAELPQITLRVPRTLDLSAGGAVWTNVGSSNGGRAHFDGCGDTDIAAVTGALDVALDGSGDVDVASVSGALRASLDGSGDLRIERVGGNAELSLDGSGDLRAGTVAGNVVGSLDGSGDLRVTSVGGTARVGLDGSGDVDFGTVQGGLDASLDGSGDVRVASVTSGQVRLRLDGSGNVTVRGGTADRLEARNGGSGNVAFGGHVASLTAEIGGSGNIEVAQADRVESIHDDGSGSVHVN